MDANFEAAEVTREENRLERSSFRSLALMRTRRPSDGTYWANVIAKVTSSVGVSDLIRRGKECDERSEADGGVVKAVGRMNEVGAVMKSSFRCCIHIG